MEEPTRSRKRKEKEPVREEDEGRFVPKAPAPVDIYKEPKGVETFPDFTMPIDPAKAVKPVSAAPPVVKIAKPIVPADQPLPSTSLFTSTVPIFNPVVPIANLVSVNSVSAILVAEPGNPPPPDACI